MEVNARGEDGHCAGGLMDQKWEADIFRLNQISHPLFNRYFFIGSSEANRRGKGAQKRGL